MSLEEIKFDGTFNNKPIDKNEIGAIKQFIKEFKEEGKVNFKDLSPGEKEQIMEKLKEIGRRVKKLYGKADETEKKHEEEHKEDNNIKDRTDIHNISPEKKEELEAKIRDIEERIKKVRDEIKNSQDPQLTRAVVLAPFTPFIPFIPFKIFFKEDSAFRILLEELEKLIYEIDKPGEADESEINKPHELNNPHEADDGLSRI